MIVDHGTLSLGAVAPGALMMHTAGLTGINLALPDILARLAALQAFAPQPINFAVSLALAESILGGVTLAISAGLPVPDISAQIAMVQALIQALLQVIQLIETQINILNSFTAYLTSGGIQALTATNTASLLGSDLSGAVVDGAPAYAVVLIARSPEAEAALQALMIS